MANIKKNLSRNLNNNFVNKNKQREFNWITKNNAHNINKENKDVFLSIVRNKDESHKNRVAISFYNECYKYFVDGDDLKVAIAEMCGRIYFKYDEYGYTLSMQKSRYCEVCRTQLSDKELYRIAEKYEGYYDMEYDEENDLYYIEYN